MEPDLPIPQAPETPELLRVEYVVNREDLLALLRYSWNARLLAQCGCTGLFLGAVLALIGYSSAIGDPRTAGQATASGWIGAAAGKGVMVAFVAWFRWLFLRQIEQLPGRLGLHTLEIFPAGFRLASSIGEATSNWSPVSRIASTPTHVIIGTKLGRAEIIPRSAFPSLENADTFVDATRRWHAEYCRRNGPG